MKPKTIIHTSDGAKIKSPWSFRDISATAYEGKSGQFLRFRMLTDHGSERECLVPVENVTRIEAL
jgi:hypothetical protein